MPCKVFHFQLHNEVALSFFVNPGCAKACCFQALCIIVPFELLLQNRAAECLGMKCFTDSFKISFC